MGHRRRSGGTAAVERGVRLTDAGSVAEVTAPPNVSVLVCRGCCCGTGKHPDVDHDGQLRRLGEATGVAGARLHVVDCLGPCERSNVVVVRRGATRHWFGEVLDGSTTDALADWVATGAPGVPPPALRARRFDPTLAAAVRVRRSPAGGGALAAFVAELLEAGVGAWTVGVLGAVVEYCAGPGDAVVSRDGTVVTAVSEGGALQVAVDPEVAAFALSPVTADEPVVALVLAAPVATLAPVHDAVRRLGPDREALRDADRGVALFDLGLGRPGHRFCLRTADPELAGILADLDRRAAGWPELLGPAGALLVDPARSPHRVVGTAHSRAEVFGPIPPPGGVSPDGPHTHLLAGELELGRDLPSGLELPPGWAPVATFHPPPGWRAPDGFLPTD